jgi:cell wall-associated NlpC family hydrolase
MARSAAKRWQRRSWLSWFAVGGVGILVGSAFLLFAAFVVIIAGPIVTDDGRGNLTIVNSAGIPPEYLPMIIDAANSAGCSEVTPALLAAQLHQESGFNPRAHSPAGAMGIAQFMPGTWKTHGHGDVWNPADAIPAAGRYDCAVGRAVASVAGDRQSLMLAAYNAGPLAVLAYAGIPPYTETRNYVRAILAQAEVYGNALQAGQTISAEDVAPVIDFMKAQVGKAYVWGANGPDAWDCSSLVQAAYRKIGIELPRVTTEQVNFGPRVAAVNPQPGDLLFTVGPNGTRSAPGHVGMYVGNGRVIAAKGARWGVVESALSDWTGVVAATRPLAVRA